MAERMTEDARLHRKRNKSEVPRGKGMDKRAEPCDHAVPVNDPSPPRQPPADAPPTFNTSGVGPGYRDAVSSGALHAAYGTSAQRKPSDHIPLSMFGDAAGEYMRMQRGRYDAWVHVVFAFIGQIGIIGLIPGMIATYIAAFCGADTSTVLWSGLIVGGILGAVGAFFTFRDRWRCIEAFSSRFCSGLANLSVLYVPLIALVYANVRGVQKLFGK